MKTDLIPIEELDQSILNLCTRINVATYELLILIRQFDERAGFLKWGLQNSAEWLAYRCDLSMTTAREKVRVAHALKTLPAIAESFSTGELSYTKVKELTRVAVRQNEDNLLEIALRNTATVVAEYCRELRFGLESSTDVAARAFAGRSLRMRRDHQRDILTVTIELPIDRGKLLEMALDKARDEEVLEVPDLVDTSWSTRQADAFVNIVSGYLAGDSEASSDNFLVTVHVDQSALAGNDGRSGLPIESVKRLCCDGKAVVLTENRYGEPLSIGRKSRIVPIAMQRAVRARDNNCCTFPGCNNRRFLQSHHVEHWSNGGHTSLDNLMLLCTRHHTLVHEGGFRIEKDFLHNWYFVRPDGVAVPDCGYIRQDMIDTKTGEISDPYENPPAGGLLSAAEKTLREPPPPRFLH